MAVQMKSLLEDVDKIYDLIKSGDREANRWFVVDPVMIRNCLNDPIHINLYLMWSECENYLQSVLGRRYSPSDYYYKYEDKRGYHFYRALFRKMLENTPRVDLSVWVK